MARHAKSRKGRGGRTDVNLDTWLERVRKDPAEEPAFFQQVLEATVYVHAPASDDSGKLRLVQFRHPEGFDAIPFFTSLSKAQTASSSAVRILAVLGRELLTGTRGATLMLNPNDGGAVLYPEEIASLLDTGFVARIEKTTSSGLLVRPPQSVPAWLAATIRSCVQQTEFIDAAYILESYSTEAGDHPPGLLIYLVADFNYAERAARLITAAIQPLCSERDPVIDVMIHDATQPLPDCLAQPTLTAVFTKRPDA